MTSNNKTKWYAAGLHFECTGCGQCCSGPGEGYVWITKPEVKFLAEHLSLTLEDTHKKYLRRIIVRHSIIEHPKSKDCIFLSQCADSRSCSIYPVRPNQCRTWPFWDMNLLNSDMWNSVAITCPGINRGKYYSFEEVEKLKKQNSWWNDEN
ncbi:MAG: YkgJ family cysteine cluster protein [Planctomycetes bacterium]|nr:YkgJ family cysteine cluster protein [Planctomycetota bacterium]